MAASIASSKLSNLQDTINLGLDSAPRNGVDPERRRTSRARRKQPLTSIDRALLTTGSFFDINDINVN